MLKNLTIFLFLNLCLQLYSQEPIRFSTKQGLPTNHVYDIQEGVDGFMWFATNRGVVKYDGETFRTFTIKDGLPNNDTYLLETDYQNRLWYFSKSDYQGFIKNDSIYKFQIQDKKVITPQSISKSKNKIWFWGNEIKYFDNKSLVNGNINKIKYLEFQLKIVQKYGIKNKDKFQYSINLEKKEIVRINQMANRIEIYDWDMNLKREILLFSDNFTISNSFKASGIIYNQISYFAYENGVLFIDLENDKTHFLTFKNLFNENKTLYFRCKGLKNHIQISIPGHLAILDYNLNLKESYSFSEKLGQYSYKDSKGNLWLASITSGVSLVPNTEQNKTIYFESKKVQKINALDENLYVGLNNKGIYQLNTKTKEIEKLEDFKIPHSEIYQIKKDDSLKYVYVVTARNSYSIFNNKIERIEVKNTKDLILDKYSISGGKDIFISKKNIYLAGSGNLIKSSDKENFSKIILYKEGITSVNSFKKNIYVGAIDGLHQLTNDSLSRLKIDHPLLQTYITNLYPTNENLFVGTDGRGVFSYNGKKVIHFKHTDRYSVQKIIKKDSLLWLATNNGVHQLTIDKDKIEDSKITNSFYEADGLLQNNTNDIYLDKDALYVASDIGLVKLNTKSALYQQKPNLYFKTKSKKLKFAEESRENISLTFALQDYVNQENVRYQYRLLPNQKKWTSTQTKTINFSNLNPNSYTLQVKATDQHKNESIAIQNFRVVPFWYETILAKIGFILLGALLFLLVLYSIKKRIQLKETEKAEQEKRVAGLELQALRSQMNPHFVHNSLNAIQYFIQLKEVELSENYLSKFSTLIRLFFEYSRRKTISIQEEADLLEHYLSIEKLRFEDKLTFKINIDDKLDVTEQQIPSMILQPIVENAVNHGLFHKKENGKIVVSFIWLDDNAFKVVIKDDGIGIKKSKEIYKSSAKNYRSSSTDVLKERFKLLEQSNTWKIKYTILDLLEKEEEGTEVSITFTPILL